MTDFILRTASARRIALRFAHATIHTLFLVAGCSAQEKYNEAYASSFEAVIYDTDDRIEYVDTKEPWKTLARNSTVALIPGASLVLNADGFLRVSALTLGERFGLCPNERFASEPSAAECSAILLVDDIVVTEGHCFGDNESCDKFAYVLDYYLDENNRVRIPQESVFGCRRIITKEVLGTDNPLGRDFAVVQLDRSPTRPQPVISKRVPSVGDPLVITGYPSGIPLKMDNGGVVLSVESPTRDYFKASLDAFGGNSGSPVFNSVGEVIGVFSAGAPMDYTWDDGCAKSRVVDLAADDAGELVLNISTVIKELCRINFPNPSLCGIDPICGDSFCSAGEPETCNSDCPPPRCLGTDCLAHIPLTDRSNTDSHSLNITPSPNVEDDGESGGGCQISRAASSRGLLYPLLPLAVLLAMRRRSNQQKKTFVSFL